MTPQEEIIRAGEATQLLGSRLFVDAKKNIEDQLAQLRRNVPIYETPMHSRLILMEQLWRQLEGYFEQLAVTGRFAEIKLQQDRDREGLVERGIAMFRNVGRNSI